MHDCSEICDLDSLYSYQLVATIIYVNCFKLSSLVNYSYSYICDITSKVYLTFNVTNDHEVSMLQLLAYDVYQ